MKLTIEKNGEAGRLLLGVLAQEARARSLPIDKDLLVSK